MVKKPYSNLNLFNNLHSFTPFINPLFLIGRVALSIGIRGSILKNSRTVGILRNPTCSKDIKLVETQ